MLREQDEGMKQTLLALGVVGLVGIALVGAGCGGKAEVIGGDAGGVDSGVVDSGTVDSGAPDSSVADTGGGDTGRDAGGPNCTTPSKCPADPLPTQSQIQQCEADMNDPTCGADFTALLDCAYANQTCDASGHTMPLTACSAQVMAYLNCIMPPFDGGTMDAGPPSCTTKSKCPADPPPTQSEIQACQMDMNDPRCGADFTALLDCAYANQMCDASGHTVQTNACNAQVMAYVSCISPPADAGGSGG
jgi:hypothetical protein